MDKNRRLKEIVEILKRKSAVSIKDLRRRLDVSEMTVRRDLNVLEEDNIVELIPGGAIFRTLDDIEEGKYNITHEETVRTREKVKIGQRAASIIEPNDTVILDVGSTVEYVAKFIPREFPVTVICSTLNILVEIYRKKNCSPIFTGGYFHDNTLMFESPEGIRLINRTRTDKGFVSAAGIHETLGVTCANPYEVETKQAAIGSSKTKILTADSTKFGKTKISYFAELDEFDVIITDSGISDEYRDIIVSLGIDLIIV